MDRSIERWLLGLTLTLLFAAVLLISLGLAGLSSGWVVAVGLAATAAALLALVRGLGTDALGYALPQGAALAAVVALRWLDATPGELQALGGVLGLLGLTNFFLRPVYRLGYALVTEVNQFRREMREHRE